MGSESGGGGKWRLLCCYGDWMHDLRRGGEAGTRQVVRRPAQADGCYEAGRPRATVHPPATVVGRDRSPAPQQIERWRKVARGGQPRQKCRRAVAECSNTVPGCLTSRTRGQMTFNLDALRTAQGLVEIRVKLLLRNVPH